MCVCDSVKLCFCRVCVPTCECECVMLLVINMYHILIMDSLRDLMCIININVMYAPCVNTSLCKIIYLYITNRENKIKFEKHYSTKNDT